MIDNRDWNVLIQDVRVGGALMMTHSRHNHGKKKEVGRGWG